MHKGENVMPAASILIKPASANCNIDCEYCFYKCLSSNREKFSLGFMSEATLDSLIKNAIDYADDYLTFAFQGGEPTLVGLDFFKKAVALQKKYLAETIEKTPAKKQMRIENTLQTNGLLLDEEWAEFLQENHFLVGLSLDGPRKVNGARVGVSGDETFDKVMHTISILRQYDVDFNIISVITEQTTSKAGLLYKFYKRNHFDYVQMIPCMDEAGRENDIAKEAQSPVNPYAVTPKSYGKFLCDFFDLWYEDFKAGDIMDVRMFSNLAQISVGYPAEQCGMNGCCSCYFVVEGDGSVYPCDFYCGDNWKLGTVQDGFQALADSVKAREFVETSKQEDVKCLKCKHFSLCRGGCRRWREPFVEGKPRLNTLCSGYEMFFEYTAERIKKLGRTIVEPGYRL
jgi:uncharacterized protein